MVAEETLELIYQHMLKLDDFTSPGGMAKRLGYDRSTLSVAFREGLKRGWYETRGSSKHLNPQTGGPATEYKAVPRKPGTGAPR